MRMLSNEELRMVAGGAWYDFIIAWFQADGQSGGDMSLGGPMQTVTVTGSRMSDAQAIAYDIAQLQAAMPNCTVAITIAPEITAGTVSVTASAAMAITGGMTITKSTNPVTVTCPPSNGGGGGGPKQAN